MYELVHSSFKLFENYEKIIFYAVDPGAYNMFNEIMKGINMMKIPTVLYCHGWAAKNVKDKFYPVEMLKEALKRNSNNTLFVLGSQVNFIDTINWIKYAKNIGLRSLFVFDHWKNYTNHFVVQSSKETVLSDYIFVPDSMAKDALLESFKEKNINIGDELNNKIIVSKHFFLEEQCAQIRNIDKNNLDQVRKNFDLDKKPIILILLDPECEQDKDYPGYTPKSILKSMYETIQKNYLNHKIIIKSHPRQNHDEVKVFLQTTWNNKLVDWLLTKDADIVNLIAMSAEVWGMTTIALIVANAVGKKIKSFQVGRNSIGLKQSNDIIERFVII